MSLKTLRSWERTEFGCLANEISKRNSDCKALPVMSVTKHHGFVPSEDYFSKKVYSKDTRNYKIVRNGQFAYATIHLDEGSVDFLRCCEAGLISPMYTVFEINEKKVCKEFLLSLLKHDARNGRFDALGNGGVNRRKSISFSNLAKYCILLPSLLEQYYIVDVLASIDEAINATRAVIAQTERVKRDAICRLLSKGIGHKNYKQTDIGDIPESWAVRKFSEVCSSISVGIASSATHAYQNAGTLLLRNQNIKSGYIDLSDTLSISAELDQEYRSKRVRTGDVITMRTGYPGRSAVISPELDGCQTFTTLISRPIPSLVASEFACIWINSQRGMEEIRKRQAGGAQQNLNAGSLKQLPIPIPPLAEQKKIVDLSFSFPNQSDLLLDRLKSIRSAVAADLLSGRKRSFDQVRLAAE